MHTRVRPTLRGVAVGVLSLLLAVFGVVAGMAVLAAAGACVLVGVLVDGLVLAVNRMHLAGRIVRDVEPNPCHTGQACTVALRLVSRRGSNPAWGGLRVHVDDCLPSAAGRMRLDASSSYQVVPSQRGAWRLGPASLTVAGPLDCWRQVASDEATTDLIAWPQVAAMDSEVVRAARTDDRLPGPTGLAVARLDDMVLRDYQPGDDLRRIHWRSSARTGQLMTRVDEPAESRHAWVTLWLDDASSGPDRELAISLAASCVMAWQRAGFAVQCHCGLRPLLGEADAQMTALALLDPDSDPSCLAPPDAPGMVDGPAVLLVCPRPPDQHADAKSGPRVDPALVPGAVPPSLWDVPRRQARVAVLLQPDEAGAGALRDAGWRPVVLQPGTQLDQAAEPLVEALAAAAGVGVR